MVRCFIRVEESSYSLNILDFRVWVFGVLNRELIYSNDTSLHWMKLEKTSVWCPVIEILHCEEKQNRIFGHIYSGEGSPADEGLKRSDFNRLKVYFENGWSSDKTTAEEQAWNQWGRKMESSRLDWYKESSLEIQHPDPFVFCLSLGNQEHTFLMGRIFKGTEN